MDAQVIVDGLGEAARSAAVVAPWDAFAWWVRDIMIHEGRWGEILQRYEPHPEAVIQGDSGYRASAIILSQLTGEELEQLWVRYVIEREVRA